MSIEDNHSMYSRLNVRIRELNKFLRSIDEVEDLFTGEFEEYLSLVKDETLRRLEALLNELQEYDR